jgi:signal transduction histidine kinase/CheY-like chemotaxis protein
MQNYLLSVKKPLILFSDVKDWFKSIHYFNEDSFVIRIRSFQITSFTFFLLNSFLNFLSNLVTSYIITAASCMALLIVRHLIDNGKVKQAYRLMLIAINFSVAALSYFEGLRSGAFLFFFPTFFSFIFLVDPSDKKNQLFTYIGCISAFIIAIIASPYSSELIVRGRDVSRENFMINILMSFFLIAWMAYHLVRENNRKQTTIKNKEVFLDTIFNSSLHTDIIVDLESGCISDCNRGSALLFALPEGKSLRNMVACELFTDFKTKEGKKILKEICNSEKNWQGELTCIRMDGTEFPASINIVTFRYNEKTYKKITIVDITEKNQILHDLQVAKSKAEESAVVKSQFLSHMSHELRTPLNGIIGSTNLLLQDDFLPDQKDQLSILKFSSEHMLNLINDVLDLSKLEANKMQLEKAVIDIPKFIDQIASTFDQQYQNKGLSFEINVDEELQRPLLVDPTRLNQVLTNLLSNAFKFTAKGSVTLDVKAIALKSDFHTIRFSVTDTGIGISEDKKEKIFEQFAQADIKTTRRYGGTGLGLTISQRIVEIMGGRLKVESKYNKGSKFYFDLSLPVHLSKKKAFINENAPLSVNENLKGFRVLIAEDNPINMLIATKFLDKWGIIHEKAKNGVEAVSLFNNGNFDMVLMDLEMPEMDGYSALNAIRKIDSSIPAIAFTAAVFDNMKESLTNSGFNDYVQKPFRPEDLQSKLIAFSESLKKRA